MPIPGSSRSARGAARNRWIAAVAVAAAVGLALVGVAWGRRTRPAVADGPRMPVVLKVLDGSQLGEGWLDWGYSRHTLRPGSAAEVDFSGYGGLILAHPGLRGEFGGLSFRYRAPADFGDFLEVQLHDASGHALARVPVRSEGAPPGPDGFREVWLSMAALNPHAEHFERVMFFSHRDVDDRRVALDAVGLTGAPPPPPPEPARSASFAIDCRAPARPISPLIYGVGGVDGDAWSVGATTRRWGGNPTSRYNWELGTWNSGSDWFFRNRGGDDPADVRFVAENAAHGAETVLTIPMLGWVAKDAEAYSFPVSVYGSQQATAPEQPDAGNGVSRDGVPLEPLSPQTTSVGSTPESVERWVRRIHDGERDGGAGAAVHRYILDNEPMLWNVTHRDVHPDPTTYDELLTRTVAYASAVRRADPDAIIGGPAEWGWLGYLYSAADRKAGLWWRPDRRAHGDVPLIPWYLRALREREQRSGTRLLDLLDVHYYSMAPGVGLGVAGHTDPAGAALRIRSTRSLWDPGYVDESWIREPIRLIPRLREWIEENHPGLGISIGEWNFGGELHASGGLAVAEVLGRLGREGIASAYYWTVPPARSPAFWAFRAFRDFDGGGGRFLDLSEAVRGGDDLSSLFASRDAGGNHQVAVLLNLSPRAPLAARISLQGCGAVAHLRVYTYAGDDRGFAPGVASVQAGELAALSAPYTITVLDLTTTPGP
jgi:hypothetical protein